MTDSLSMQSATVPGNRRWLSDAWEAVRRDLRRPLGENATRCWIDRLVPHSATDREVVLAAPSAFVRDHILANFMNPLRTAWSKRAPEIQRVRIVVGQPDRPTSGGRKEASAPLSDYGAAPQSSNRPGATALRPSFKFDFFVCGPTNKLACALAKEVAESDAPHFSAPLYIYADEGCGKSHLLHATGHLFKETFPDRPVMHLSAEEFMYHYIRAVQDKTAIKFKEHVRKADLLLVDNIQSIAGRTGTQVEFLHTLNAMIDGNKRILVTGDRPPESLDGMERGIRSRLAGGLAVEIRPADKALRREFLRVRSKEMLEIYPELRIEDEALEFLAARMTSSIRSLQGAFSRLVAEARLVGGSISSELASDRLQDLLRHVDRRISLAAILRLVASYYEIEETRILSRERGREVTSARQVAMYLAKECTGDSVSVIGAKLGGRTHATVVYALKKMRARRTRDPRFDGELRYLVRSLRS